MRRVFLNLAIVLVVAALASCGFGVTPTDTTGTLSFAFPKGSLTRALGDEEYSVEIYYGLDRLEQEPDVVGDVVTYTDLPAGRATVIVAQGRKDDVDGFFYSTAYGELEVVINPGENGPYTLDLEATPFVPADGLQGVDVVGLTDLDGTVYAAAEDALYSGPLTDDGLVLADGPAVPLGVKVYSLSIGGMFEGDGFASRVWVNASWSASTGGGIMPWVAGDPDELDLEFSAGFADYAASDVQVLRSGVYADEVYDDLVIFFQRDGGIGGLYLTRGEETLPRSDWPWIVDEINLTEQLGDVVSADQEPILDLTVAESSLYLVSSFVTVRVSSDILNDEVVPNPSVDTLFDSEIVAFAPGLDAVILSVAVGDTPDGKRLYLGTSNGLVAGAAAGPEESAFFSEATDDEPPAWVLGTAGYAVTRIAPSDEGTYVAYVSERSDGRQFLTVRATDGEESVTLRAIHGLPGYSVRSMEWLDDATLLVAGDHGLAVFDATGLDVVTD